MLESRDNALKSCFVCGQDQKTTESGQSEHIDKMWKAHPSCLAVLKRAYEMMPKTLVQDLLRYCGVWSPNLAAEPLEMARNEGRRLVGLYILHRLGEIILPKESL